jgi:hypothetical protein
MMRRDDVMMLRECVLQCSREVCRSSSIPIGPEVEDVFEAGIAGQVAAFIGFGGKQLRGTLTLVAPFELMRAAYPMPARGGAPAPDADVLDWAGELANELLGRITNRLSALGVELMCSTPKAIHVDLPRILAATPMTVCALRLHCGSDQLGVWFDAVSDEPALFPSAPAPVAWVAEGEVTLF